ncbi:MAG: hypothetical protein NT092_12695 [Bacteroidia bacterium]|nr:hypothetical protein [Bacteroidia bacterium]
MKKVLISIFWILIIAGLIIRLLSLSYNGIFDIDAYYEWGYNSLKSGLNEGYQGIYFPFQYQLFEAGAWIADTFNIGHHAGFKILNLIFDIANLVILFLLFRKLKISKYYLLLYWIHPWFLIMFSQGYCDFQFTFFILCAFYLALNGSARSYLLSGLFLGLAMHMKPQVQIIVLSIFIYSMYLLYKNRDTRLLHMFVFPVIIFANYSLYFLIQSGNPFTLLRDFVDLDEAMPLTANFLNGWFPIAYNLIKPGDPIYSVCDNITIAHISLRTFALVILLMLIFLFIRRLVSRTIGTKNNYSILLLGSFSTFIFPFIMTAAHENHLFLATVLLVLISGKINNVLAKICIHIILLLQCINLYGFYGFGESKTLKFISISYSYEIAVVLSLIAFIAFLFLTVYFLNRKSDILISFDQN